MTREDTVAKAKRLLVTGAVVILEVNQSTVEVRASVTGDTATYIVAFTEATGYTCDCPAYSRRCSHVRAVELVRPASQAGDHPRHLHAVNDEVAR